MKRNLVLHWVTLVLSCAVLTEVTPRGASCQDLFLTIRTQNLDIRYMQGVSAPDAQRVADFLQQEYEAVTKSLGLEPGKKIEVRIYDGVGRFLAEAGLKKPWRGAYYTKGILHCQPVQALIQREIFEKTLTYELSRAVLNIARDKGCPMWLTESYAAFRVGEFKNMSAPIGAKLSSFSDLNQDIQQHPDPPQRDDVQYILGQTFNFFILQYGERKALGLYREFDGMKTVDGVFRKVLGDAYDAVEKGWSKYIVYHTSPFKK